MKTTLKVVAGTLFSGWFMLLWSYKMLLSSNIPVRISFDEMRSTLLTIIVSTLIMLLYIRIVKKSLLWCFFLFPSLFWAGSMVMAIKYQYHDYDTTLSVAGFVGCLCIILYSLPFEEIKKIVKRPASRL